MAIRAPKQTKSEEALPQRLSRSDMGEADAESATADPGLFHLQNVAGNRAVQAKLELGAVDSPLEAEADRVADEVAGPAGGSQSHAAGPDDAGPLDPETSSAIAGATGGGRSLDASVRGDIEATMGADLSGVRVHTDAKADELSRSIKAKAFTTGNDVFFKSGAYDPASTKGRHLIAHEVAHTQQQAPAVARKISDELAAELDTRPLPQVPAVAEPQVGEAAPAPTAAATEQAAEAPAASSETASSEAGATNAGVFQQSEISSDLGRRMQLAQDPRYQTKKGSSSSAKAKTSAGAAVEMADAGLGVAGLGGGIAKAAGAVAAGTVASAGAIGLGAIATVGHTRNAIGGQRMGTALEGTRTESQSSDATQVQNYAGDKLDKRKKRSTAAALIALGATSVSIAALATSAPLLIALGAGLAVLNFGVSMWRRWKQSGKRKKAAAVAAVEVATLAFHGRPEDAAAAIQFVESLGITEMPADLTDLAKVIEGKLGREFGSERYVRAQQLLSMLTDGEPGQAAEAEAILNAIGLKPGALRKLVTDNKARDAMKQVASALTGGG